MIVVKIDKKTLKNCQQVKKIDYYYIKDNIYELPIFELFNLYDNSFIWKLKYPIYKLIYNLTYGREKRNETKEKT